MLIPAEKLSGSLVPVGSIPGSHTWHPKPFIGQLPLASPALSLPWAELHPPGISPSPGRCSPPPTQRLNAPEAPVGRLAPQPTKHSVAAFIRTHPALSWPLRILPGRRLVPAVEPSTGPAQGRCPSLNGGSYYLPGCSQGARPFPVSPDTPQWVLGPSTTKPRSSPWHQGHRDVAPPTCLGPPPHPVLPLCSSLTIQEASGPPDVPRTLCLGAFAFAVVAVSKPSLRVAACRRSAHFLHVSGQMSLLFKREAFPVHSRSLLPLYFSAQQCRYVSLKPGDSQQVLGKYLLTTQTLC